MNSQQMDDSEVLQKLRSFCAYRERAEFEVRQKAREFSIDDVKMEKILSQLIQEGFVSDERFAEVFARSKFRQNQWGKYKIRAAMLEKRINSALIDMALLELDQIEYESTARALIQSLFKKGKTADQIFNSMKSKGYEGDLIYSILQSMNLV